ncbi:MAG: ABC transporter substrate-binding protein [Acetobacteraceae bacterium]|nr:ABC transporter substrate-binding protein [Acetobacteraceae bacterium]
MLAVLSPGGSALAVERVVSLNLCTDQWLVLLAPEKVAALSPLARDSALSFVAPQAAGLPMVRASAEAVLALHPDLVLGARYGARTTLELLERAGMRVARLELPSDFPGIRLALRTTAVLLGIPDRAEPLIAAMDAGLPLPGPPANALVWLPRGLTSGPDGMMASVLHQAGLTNTGSGARVGLEVLLRRPPAWLILSENSGGASLATDMLKHPAVRAIRSRAVPAPLTICPGPFTVEAVALLAR